MDIASTALAWAKTKIGCKYSQPLRMLEGHFDCSSLVYRAFKTAGYKMCGSTSTNEVNDKGFDLIWPASHDMIGRRFYTLQTIQNAGWTPLPGDLIFYNQKTTTRKNKITHVAFVLDEEHILHARNPKMGVLVNDIALYDGTICAVTRFREEMASGVPEAEDEDCRTADAGLTASRRVLIVGGSVVVRDKPGIHGNRIITAHMGDEFKLLGIVDGWYEIGESGRFITGNARYAQLI